jgi:hypothetical protein
MSELIYKTGDRVLVSRAEDGENHEEGTVHDAYTLLIGPEVRPMVVVLFEDGKRELFNAIEPNVLPVVAEEEEGEEADDGEPEADDGEPVADG